MSKDPNRRSLFKTLRSYASKCTLNLQLAARRLRQLTDDQLSSDEIVNELFLVTSSSSISPSVLEQPLTEPTDNVTESITREETRMTLPPFEEFNSVEEANALRTEGVPFTQGDKVWQKRRDAWLNSTEEERNAAKQRQHESMLTGVPKDSYPVVYYNLVDKQKTLKKPMNLKDAVKVINAGWVSGGKWERAAHGLA